MVRVRRVREATAGTLSRGHPRPRKMEVVGGARSSENSEVWMEELSPGQARAVCEAAPDGILVVDEDGRIRHANRKLEELFGYSREELEGQEVEVLVPERDRSGHRRERREYAEDPRTRPMGVGLELLGRRKDGSEFPVEISLSPIPDQGRETRVVAIVRDVSERRRLEEFGTGALRSAEEERRRIARELHDDTAQRLATLMIRLRLMERAKDLDAREELLEEIRQELLETSEAVRRMARGLRPPALEEVGVVAAVRSHARSVEETTGLEVELEIEPVADGLEEEAQLALYRIVQEALSNVVRHADASRAVIHMRLREDRLVAQVEDDGRGFEPDDVSPGRMDRLGLIGMEERAALVDGTVRVDSSPGEGTRVRLEIPVERRSREQAG